MISIFSITMLASMPNTIAAAAAARKRRRRGREVMRIL